jgi:hypothetical protein
LDLKKYALEISIGFFRKVKAIFLPEIHKPDRSLGQKIILPNYTYRGSEK